MIRNAKSSSTAWCPVPADRPSPEQSPKGSTFMRWFARQDWIADACITGMFALTLVQVVFSAFYMIRLQRYGWGSIYLLSAWLTGRVAGWMARNR